jgi:hypothetical protein
LGFGHEGAPENDGENEIVAALRYWKVRNAVAKFQITSRDWVGLLGGFWPDRLIAERNRNEWLPQSVAL